MSRRSATESCGPVSAAMQASWIGRKIPTRQWSLSRLIRSTISAFPTTNPTRQPAMPYDLDIENISTPTSFAPGPGERRHGRVVRVVRIGQLDNLPLVSEHERKLDNRCLGPGHDRDLGV